MPEEHIKPPETIKEVGIHIGYMSKDITELKDLVKEQAANYATKVELAIVAKEVEELKDDRKWIQRSIGERLINWGATIAVGAYAFLNK